MCCQDCGDMERLTVHHLVPARVAPELAFAADNLITLCRSCHGRREVVERRARAHKGGWVQEGRRTPGQGVPKAFTLAGLSGEVAGQVAQAASDIGWIA